MSNGGSQYTPMYDKGRHDAHTRQNQKARYHLRAGIAKVALEAKRDGKPAEDCVGRPLQFANEMAERHNTKQLVQWSKGYKPAGFVGGMEFCPTCHKVPKFCEC